MVGEVQLCRSQHLKVIRKPSLLGLLRRTQRKRQYVISVQICLLL